MRTKLGFQFWCYDHVKSLEYIKDTLRSVWMWKDGTNDKYRMGSQTVINKQIGKLCQNGSVG